MTAPAVAVVTGGGSGIGLAACARLAKEGFAVAALDLDPAAAAGTAALIAVFDVTSEAIVDAALAAVASRLGPVDVLVNNAGITGSRQVARCHETRWGAGQGRRGQRARAVPVQPRGAAVDDRPRLGDR